MKCVICHGDDITVTEVREEIPLDNDIVYLTVKIPLCRTCGERYYDRRTIQFLEEFEEKLKRKQIKLKEVGKVLQYYEEASQLA